jgi:hypothetical protein
MKAPLDVPIPLMPIDDGLSPASLDSVVAGGVAKRMKYSNAGPTVLWRITLPVLTKEVQIWYRYPFMDHSHFLYKNGLRNQTFVYLKHYYIDADINTS